MKCFTSAIASSILAVLAFMPPSPFASATTTSHLQVAADLDAPSMPKLDIAQLSPGVSMDQGEQAQPDSDTPDSGDPAATDTQNGGDADQNASDADQNGDPDSPDADQSAQSDDNGDNSAPEPGYANDPQVYTGDNPAQNAANSAPAR